MKKRYSHIIKPLQILVDVFIINFIVLFISDKAFLNASFLSFITAFWFLISFFLGFYKVYRYTSIFKIISLLCKQGLLFTLGYFSYFGIFTEGVVVNNQFLILVTIFSSISLVKLLWIFLLKKYRSLGKNYRTTIVIGFDASSKNIIDFFKSKANLGYKYLGCFSNEVSENGDFLGNFNDVFTYVIENTVDEIYCSLTSLSENQIKEINKFSIDKNIILKLIPNSNELYNNNQKKE